MARSLRPKDAEHEDAEQLDVKLLNCPHTAME
jgi:hypothetical protein